MVSVAFLNYFRPHLSSLVFMVEQISFFKATLSTSLCSCLIQTRPWLRQLATDQDVIGNLLIALDIAFSVEVVSLLSIVVATRSSFRNSIRARHEYHGVSGVKRAGQRVKSTRKSIAFHQTSLERLKSIHLARKMKEEYEEEMYLRRQSANERRNRCQERLQIRLKRRKLEAQLRKEKTGRTSPKKLMHDADRLLTYFKRKDRKSTEILFAKRMGIQKKKDGDVLLDLSKVEKMMMKLKYDRATCKDILSEARVIDESGMVSLRRFIAFLYGTNDSGDVGKDDTHRHANTTNVRKLAKVIPRERTSENQCGGTDVDGMKVLS